MITFKRLILLSILLTIPFSSSSFDIQPYNTPTNRAYALAGVAGIGALLTGIALYSAWKDNHALQNRLNNTIERYKDQEFLNELHDKTKALLATYSEYECTYKGTNTPDLTKKVTDQLNKTLNLQTIGSFQSTISSLRSAWSNDTVLKDLDPSEWKEGSLLALQAAHIRRSVVNLRTLFQALSEQLPYTQALLFETAFAHSFDAEKELEQYFSLPHELESRLDTLVVSRTYATDRYPYIAYNSYLTQMLQYMMNTFMTPLAQTELLAFQKPLMQSLTKLQTLLVKILQHLRASKYYRIEYQQHSADEAHAQQLREQARKHELEVSRQKEENTRLQEKIAHMGDQLKDLSSKIDKFNK